MSESESENEQKDELNCEQLYNEISKISSKIFEKFNERELEENDNVEDGFKHFEEYADGVDIFDLGVSSGEYKRARIFLIRILEYLKLILTLDIEQDDFYEDINTTPFYCKEIDEIDLKSRTDPEAKRIRAVIHHINTAIFDSAGFFMVRDSKLLSYYLKYYNENGNKEVLRWIITSSYPDKPQVIQKIQTKEPRKNMFFFKPRGVNSILSKTFAEKERKFSKKYFKLIKEKKRKTKK